MAVAAYASLLSLTHLLDNLHYRAPFHLPRLDVKLVETLQENVRLLLEFVELHSESKNSKIEGLWKELNEVAFEAEDKIDFHVVNQLQMRCLGETSSDASISALCEEIEILISRTNFIKQELLSSTGEELEHVQAQKQPRGFPPVPRSSAASSSSKSVVVGIDEHVHRIMEELTRDESNLQILPIVGMGGIGKTTLTQNIFENPYIVERFDRRIWLTISQEYSAEKILMNLLDKGGNKGSDENLEKLGVELYKELFGRRYLIVMDDIWSTNAWDELRKFFPNNENHSRIMVTTRLTKVAACVGSCDPYFLTSLEEDKSWDLFCLNTFDQIGCPHPELERIGKKIVKSCSGLPLEITVIGRLLANSDMRQEYWEIVANNIASFGNSEDDEHCLKILFLSYKSLPVHLKPCFLYMRTFPEDKFIYMSELIDLWISEGFIKSINDKSLEETGNGYAQDLIDRNLIFKKGNDVEVGIHDLLRDLCIRESKKEEFIWSPRVQNLFPYYRAEMDCFLCCEGMQHKKGIQLPMVGSCSSSLQVNVLVCDACRLKCMHRKCVRLVPTIDEGHRDSWLQFMQPTKVRFLLLPIRSCELTFLSLPSLNLVWNLQFIDICLSDYLTQETTIDLPREIWEMPQLRIINVQPLALLPDPIAATNVEEKDFMILKNLQYLTIIRSFKCSKEILDRIPNLMVLNISYKDQFERELFVINKKRFECLKWYSLRNLARLHKLVVLEVQNAKENIGFSNSLKEIRLIDCRMAWKDMSILGSLPRLENLVLDGGMEGTEWNPVEGEFLRLKRLVIQNVDLVCWTADETHFPILEHLQLATLRSLEEVPLAIGDIPTLRVINVWWCSGSVNDSVENIREEQESLGNETLEVSF